MVVAVDEHCGSCPCRTNVLDCDKGAVEITCRIWELRSTRCHATDQNSVDKHADNFESLEFAPVGQTKGQSGTSGDADALINATGLVFEDFTTPGKASRRDLYL